MTALSKWQGPTLSLLRFVAGFVFLCHGSAKLLGIPAGALPPGLEVHLFSYPLGASGFIELVGGTLIAIGLFTRFAAFIASGEMAVAYFTVHAHQGSLPILNKGEPAVLLCFIFLYLVFAGAGPYSVDAMMRRDSVDAMARRDATTHDATTSDVPLTASKVSL